MYGWSFSGLNCSSNNPVGTPSDDKDGMFEKRDVGINTDNKSEVTFVSLQFFRRDSFCKLNKHGV